MDAIFFYHYYDKTVGPFASLSDIPVDEAKAVLNEIKKSKPNAQSALRSPEYVQRRHRCERIVKEAFLKKGGLIQREFPHYMVIEHSPWLATWFENGAFVKIPMAEFDLRTVSFTYGDSMPAFSPQEISDREYFRQVYTHAEIIKIIEKYGLPQDWNDDGKHGYERYIEAQIWSDETIGKYR